MFHWPLSFLGSMVYVRDQQTFSGKGQIINILDRVKMNSLLSREAPLLSIFPVSGRALFPSAAQQFVHPNHQQVPRSVPSEQLQPWPLPSISISTALSQAPTIHRSPRAAQQPPQSAPPCFHPCAFFQSILHDRIIIFLKHISNHLPI